MPKNVAKLQRKKIIGTSKKNSLSLSLRIPYLCEFAKLINGWKKIEINSFAEFMQMIMRIT